MDDAQAQQTNPLFGIIPKEFFTPLASPNRLVYWDCLCRLFQAMSAQLSFGIEREILVDELQFYFEQNQAAEFEEDDINGMDSRKKANEMLRLLEKYGWLEVETDKSYVQRVNFYDYAVKVMKTLLEISDGRKVEYQGYIYTIYSLVRTNTDHPAVVLQQIRDNTDMLITGLKNLNSNIKHYIDELTKHKTVAEIMNALFNDYITNIVDKAYHRLLTSDNVSKFRPEIIERLEANGHSSRYIAKTSEELAAIREIPVGQAEELVYQTLHEIVEAFRNMDDILAEINRKNTQYQRAAVNRAKFLLAGTEDVRGQMKEILLYIDKVDKFMQQKYAESKRTVLIANQKKLDNWLQLRKEEYLLRVKDTSELDELKDKYVNESDFRQKIALKKQIEILEEQKQKMVRAFHDEMSTLEEEAVNMQKQFAEGILVKTQLVTKIVIKF